MSHTSKLRWSAVAATLALTVATAAQAQVVVRDAETGKLRAATAAEIQAMNRANAVGRAGGNAVVTPRVGLITGKIDPQPITHADGTVEQELDASTLSYTVAQRNEDGSISMVCVTGTDAEAKALAAQPARSNAKTKKGHSHDVK